MDGKTVERPVSRRRFLGLAGLGAGTVAVAGAGGLTWRAATTGVFATGTGPAYTAWDRSTGGGRDAHSLVRAAVLAANAHNTQPWLFRVTGDRVDVYADTTRGMGSMDPYRREMHLSLGCAVENIVQAAPIHGLAATVTVLPDRTQPNHAARIALSPAAVTSAPLGAAIPKRHTNRAAYHTDRPLPPGTDTALTRLTETDTTRLVWLVSDADRRAFGDQTVRATQAIIADPRQSTDDYAWYRTTWAQVQAHRDGITIDASGQPPLIRAAAKLLGTTREQNDDGWLRATRDIQVPTAAAFGILVVPDRFDPVARIQTGRTWQRMHLWATTQGLAVQPLNQVIERIDWERVTGLPPRAATDLAPLLPAGWQPLMAFRIGHPTTDALPSPRRPAEQVEAS